MANLQVSVPVDLHVPVCVHDLHVPECVARLACPCVCARPQFLKHARADKFWIRMNTSKLCEYMQMC